jgi:type IV pilus secretin PilQ/predicted competence protein
MKHTLIILKAKNIMSQTKMGNLKAYSPLSLLLCFFLAVSFGCATAKVSDEASLKPQEITAITGIDIQDNSVAITVNKPFIYTIYKPADPYKIVVDLPDVSIGSFNKKLTSSKAGIVEIIPSQITSPSAMARLEMLLQTPSSVDQEYKNNVLKIKIKEDLTAKKDEVPPVPSSRKAMSETATVSGWPRGAKDFSAEEAAVDPDTPVRPLLKATEITNISFDASANAIKVLIKGNGAMTPNVFPLDRRIVIDIPDVSLKAPLPVGVVSPVKGIRAGKHDGKVRLVIDLREKTTFDVTSIGDTITVAFKRPGRESSELSAAPSPSEAMEAQPEAAAEKTETEAPAANRCEAYWEGHEKVNIDFQDQDIVPILRLFADISGCNLFIHPDVKGKATMKFRDVPWRRAFDTILKTFSLGASKEANIIRVAPLSIFAKESEEKAKAERAKEAAEPLETKIYPVSYADVKTVEDSIKSAKILSSRGSMNVDKRTSTLLVKDVPAVFPEVERLLATLDIPTPQVLIEARIVEINTAYTYDLGIQWGLNYLSTNTLTSVGGLSGVPSLSTGPFTGKNFLVDFPAKSVGALAGSGFSFGVIDPSKTLGLDLQLSALETLGKGKIISNPKILTVDNGKAKILQGQSIPVRKLTTEGTISTEFKDVVLELNVVPHITPDKSVGMSVAIKKEDLDFTIPSVEGVPGTQKKEADTNVIIKDGETVVIGGMYKVTTNDSVSGVPGLKNIPILGWLFKSDTKSTNTLELLIFITPRIVGKM